MFDEYEDGTLGLTEKRRVNVKSTVIGVATRVYFSSRYFGR
jgi:hypothetical protein